ncbi:MAG TPA: hypothetical protein VHX61_01180 [Rhizomicrobium sp.]|nr:hypothetical protein [Rhizomicrobium sp.]
MSLDRIDRPIAAYRFAICRELLDHIIAIAIAATRFAHFDTATLTAACLIRQVFEEKRIHGAFEANM